MFDTRVYGLLLAFYCGSWLSNGHSIRTTTALLETASLSRILAASSLAGLSFCSVTGLRSLSKTYAGRLAYASCLGNAAIKSNGLSRTPPYRRSDRPSFWGDG